MVLLLGAVAMLLLGAVAFVVFVVTDSAEFFGYTVEDPQSSAGNTFG